jgi:hypothetical protein
MVTERKPEIPPERRSALGADLRVLEVDNLREIQANYHQFAEAVKPILKQAVDKLTEHGIFPEEDVANGTVADCTTIKIVDVNYEAESSLGKVVIDPEGKMYICDQIRAGIGLGWIIDWASKKDAQDEDYVDFSLQALHTIANELREALSIDKTANPIPFHSRW